MSNVKPKESYEKPWKSYTEQLGILIDRGMVVTDKEKALDYLERIGYYRLSGYWFAFRELLGPQQTQNNNVEKAKKVEEPKNKRVVLDKFRSGTSFQNVVDLYVFDKQLRLLTLDALERIEVALRVDVSHTLGELDRFAYLKPEFLDNGFCDVLDQNSGLSAHHVWLSKHASLIGRSKEEFVKFYKTKYGLPMAIWEACEVWDFGTLSRLFSGMRVAEQDVIARQYGVSNGRVFATWLRSLNYFRNVCAHHSRLWNRNIIDQPRLPSTEECPWVAPFEDDSHARARCFLLLKITCHLLKVVNPRSSWPERMKAHLKAFPELSHLGLNLDRMGAPLNWEASW